MYIRDIETKVHTVVSLKNGFMGLFIVETVCDQKFSASEILIKRPELDARSTGWCEECAAVQVPG